MVGREPRKTLKSVIDEVLAAAEVGQDLNKALYSAIRDLLADRFGVAMLINENGEAERLRALYRDILEGDSKCGLF